MPDADEQPVDPATYNAQAADADRVVTTGLHFLGQGGTPADAIMSGGVAALVRFYIDQQTVAGVPVTVREVNTLFFKAVNVAAEQVIHRPGPTPN